MVVLAPGGIIRPEDIPDEVRRGRGSSLLPAPLVRATSSETPSTLRPELEFVFRTLVELRVDMDDLRREFEAYRRGGPMELASGAVVGRMTGELPDDGDVPAFARVVDGAREGHEAPEAPTREEGVVVFRPGMTIEDMERQAIQAALTEVRGNRRKAAEMLGIGERTLYRKIAAYGLDG
jgi:DNA-binding NtrC family response regulator